MIFRHSFECLLSRKEEMTKQAIHGILCTGTRLQFAETNTVSVDLAEQYGVCQKCTNTTCVYTMPTDDMRMPTCMHNISSNKVYKPTCHISMQYASMQYMYVNANMQCANMQYVNANMQYAGMQYVNANM